MANAFIEPIFLSGVGMGWVNLYASKANGEEFVTPGNPWPTREDAVANTSRRPFARVRIIPKKRGG